MLQNNLLISNSGPVQCAVIKSDINFNRFVPNFHFWRNFAVLVLRRTCAHASAWGLSGERLKCFSLILLQFSLILFSFCFLFRAFCFWHAYNSLWICWVFAFFWYILLLKSFLKNYSTSRPFRWEPSGLFFWFCCISNPLPVGEA